MSNIIRRAVLALVLVAGIAPAIAQAPPPIPGLPDTERRTSYSITASACACAVNMALYGDSTDYQSWLEVWVNGVLAPYNDSAVGWAITSPTGPLGTIPRPITDAVLTFNNPQTGVIQIVGARRPRRVSQFSESTGVSARNLNQVITDIVAMLREAWDKINDVTGRGVFAPPGETMKTLPPASQRAGLDAVFDSSGNLVPSASVPAGGIVAGNNITLSGSNPTSIGLSQGPANTFKGSLNGSTTSDIALTACTLSYQITKWVSGTGWQCGLNPVLPSRAIAATLNLAPFSAITTQGYSTPGDGGGATFQNVGTAAFKDTYITGATLVGGSGYVNAAYLGVIMTGGSGVLCEAGATVSGGAVTALSIAVPCAGFSVGDVLTAPNSFFGGTGSGFSYTVTSISTPQASFTDASGAHFQFVINGAPPSLTQFGAKGDWAGTDATATNNSPALWSANAFASIFQLPSTTLSYGQQIFVPHGSYMTCGTVNFSTGPIIFYIPISQNVRLVGSGPDDTALRECAADNGGGRHYIELCDSNAQVGQFGCAVENMSINLNAVTSAGTTAAIYSNSGQQFPLGVRLHILAGNRSCILYETGKGGAANDIWYNIDCNQAGVATSNPAFSLNSPSTQHIIRDSVIENGSASSVAIVNSSGRLIVDGLDIEGYGVGLLQNTNVAGAVSVYRNVQQNSNNCSAAIQLSSGNIGGNILFENVISGCPTTILNQQTGGTNLTANIVKPITCTTTCN